jgi:hypothetical protein
LESKEEGSTNARGLGRGISVGATPSPFENLRVTGLRVHEVAEKRSGMLREPQHERKIINAIKPPPFVLSSVEGLRKVFQQPGRKMKIKTVVNITKMSASLPSAPPGDIDFA